MQLELFILSLDSQIGIMDTSYRSRNFDAGLRLEKRMSPPPKEDPLVVPQKSDVHSRQGIGTIPGAPTPYNRPKKGVPRRRRSAALRLRSLAGRERVPPRRDAGGPSVNPSRKRLKTGRAPSARSGRGPRIRRRPTLPGPEARYHRRQEA